MVNQIYYADIGTLSSSRPAKAYDFTNGRRKVYSAGAWHEMQDSSTSDFTSDDFTSGSQSEISRLQQRAASRTRAWRVEKAKGEVMTKIYSVIIAQFAEALYNRDLRGSILREAERRAEARRLGWRHIYE